MSVRPRPELTKLINLMGAGDDPARCAVLDALYDSMIELAGRVKWAGGRAGQTQAVELVHQGILRVTSGPKSWNDTRHFLATFALAVQCARVDELRARRNGEAALSELSESEAALLIVEDGPDADVLALHEALQQLELESPLAAEVVRMRYFTQATHAEIAKDLGIPVIRARRLWESAARRLRALLR